MKKIIAILMSLCLLCTACAAFADMEIPLFEDMPLVVSEDENTVVEEAAFEGEWVLNVAFADAEYITEQTLAGSFDYNFMPYRIGDGMVLQDIQNEYGEFVTLEMPYVFEAGQLQGKDAADRDFVIELLEDGNIVMSVFFPGEDDTVICLSVYMVHLEEEAEG